MSAENRALRLTRRGELQVLVSALTFVVGLNPQGHL